jgi:hypothetical protein
VGAAEGVAGDPFVVNIDWGRAVATPDGGSDLLAGQGPALCGFFRAAAVPQDVISPVAGIGVPFICGDDTAGTVAVEDVEELEDIEEEELARCALFRGINIRATSLVFMGLSPPWPALEPHADRLLCWKLGGLATAVIGDAVYRCCYRLELVRLVLETD